MNKVNILFDASFVPSHAMAARESGIIRVEKAWLHHLIRQNDVNVLFLFRRVGKAVIMGADGERRIEEYLANPSPGERLLPRLLWKLGRKRRAIKVDIAQRAIARIGDVNDSEAVSRVLQKIMPDGGWYVTVGLTIAEDGFMSGLRKAGLRSAVMLHDTIALDLGETCVDGMDRSVRRNVAYNALEGDIILCNSQVTAENFRRHARDVTDQPPKALPVVAHLGLHSLRTVAPGRLPGELSADRPIFMILGTIEPRKNHLFLLDLWEEMARTTPPEEMPQLVVAGCWGWKIDGIREAFSASPEMGRSVFIIESPDDPTVQALMESSNALLMPSLAEGYGLPILEAARAGVPVIATDLPVYREIAGDYPDLVALDAPQEWIARLRHYAVAKVRYPAYEVPTWEAHMRTVLDALMAYDRQHRLETL